MRAPALMEPSLKYGPCLASALTRIIVGTPLGGQFDWGGRLQKRNGGSQRHPQAVRQPAVECNGIRMLDCEADRPCRQETGA